MHLEVLIGFVIALAVGLTAIGGGSFTTPALVLLIGMPAPLAVGTAFIFAAVLRLIAAPFYIADKHIHWGILKLLLLGAVPGLLIGTWALRTMGARSSNPVLLVIVGGLLVASSSVSFFSKFRKPGFARKNAKWVPWLALPLGIETGFSSAGAGALGTVLLLNFSEMTPPQVVGTDLVFGIVLAVVGGAFHIAWGSISGPVLIKLLEGGIPGVLLGCIIARV